MGEETDMSAGACVFAQVGCAFMFTVNKVCEAVYICACVFLYLRGRT